MSEPSDIGEARGARSLADLMEANAGAPRPASVDGEVAAALRVAEAIRRDAGGDLSPDRKAALATSLFAGAPLQRRVRRIAAICVAAACVVVVVGGSLFVMRSAERGSETPRAQNPSMDTRAHLARRLVGALLPGTEAERAGAALAASIHAERERLLALAGEQR